MWIFSAYHYRDISEEAKKYKVFQEGDVFFIDEIKSGEMYKRWIGTVGKDASTSVIITTTSGMVLTDPYTITVLVPWVVITNLHLPVKWPLCPNEVFEAFALQIRQTCIT